MSRPDHYPRHRIHHRRPVMSRQIAREAQPAQPSPHRLSQRVCYRSLDSTDAAFALPLSAELRSRLPQALRHAIQKRQREFLAGRWCAKQALQCLGAGSTDVAMAEDRAPIWPDGVVGSITHTGDFAAAAVAWAADIAALGIDSNRSSTPQRRATSPTSVWSMRRLSSKRPMAAAFANSAHWCFPQRSLSSSVSFR
jgi:4'-phosphopantetheinyl transferase EntD